MSDTTKDFYISENNTNVKTDSSYFGKSSKYEISAEAVLGQSGRRVLVNIVHGPDLKDYHFEEVVKLYQKTYHPGLSPIPDANKWILVTDKRTDDCLATLAITHLHDSAAPFIFHKVPMKGSVKILEELNKASDYKHNFSINDTEVGTFTLQMEKMFSSSDSLDVARLLLNEASLIGQNMGSNNCIFIAIRKVRIILKKLGIIFYPFPSSHQVFHKDMLSDTQLSFRMQRELNLSYKMADFYIKDYIYSKSKDAKAGGVNANQVIHCLSQSKIISKSKRFNSFEPMYS